MGYIEEIERINKLAKELMIHGMASSLDEAVCKAQDALRKDGSMTIDVTDIRRRLSDKEEKIKAEQTAAQSQPNSTEQPRIDWQEAMAKNTQFVVAQFNELQKTIANLGAELQNVRKEVLSLRQSQSKFEYSGSKEQQVININEDETEQRPAQPQPKKETSQRVGNYRPEDVSIEKMFYFGNK